MSPESSKARFYIGMPAIEVVKGIVRNNPAIMGISVVEYTPQERSFLELRPDEQDFSRALHQGGYDKSHQLSRERTEKENLLNNIAKRFSLESNSALGILSEVIVSPGLPKHHIPMMDFMECNLDRIKRGLHYLGEYEGVILNSGRSFHYYGFYLLDPEGWRRFMGKCLLLPGLVEPRHVGHRLVDGYCCLRLTACSAKPKTPKLVAML